MMSQKKTRFSCSEARLVAHFTQNIFSVDKNKRKPIRYCFIFLNCTVDGATNTPSTTADGATTIPIT